MSLSQNELSNLIKIDETLSKNIIRAQTAQEKSHLLELNIQTLIKIQSYHTAQREKIAKQLEAHAKKIIELENQLKANVAELDRLLLATSDPTPCIMARTQLLKQLEQEKSLRKKAEESPVNVDVVQWLEYCESTIKQKTVLLDGINRTIRAASSRSSVSSTSPSSSSAQSSTSSVSSSSQSRINSTNLDNYIEKTFQYQNKLQVAAQRIEELQRNIVKVEQSINDIGQSIRTRPQEHAETLGNDLAAAETRLKEYKSEISIENNARIKGLDIVLQICSDIEEYLDTEKNRTPSTEQQSSDFMINIMIKRREWAKKTLESIREASGTPQVTSSRGTTSSSSSSSASSVASSLSRALQSSSSSSTTTTSSPTLPTNLTQYQYR